MFDRHQVPATWAVVAALLDADSARSRPGAEACWYAPDIMDMLVRAKVAEQEKARLGFPANAPLERAGDFEKSFKHEATSDEAIVGTAASTKATTALRVDAGRTGHSSTSRVRSG